MATEQRLIDATRLEYWIDGGIHGAEVNGNMPTVNLYEVLSELYSIPIVDAVPVVRCEDCRRWEQNGNCRHGICLQEGVTLLRWKHDFCSYGERRTDNEEKLR